MAEIANFEGNNADVEYYLNAVRQRAYGDNWDASKHAYKAGSFLENEVAILQDKAKEFLPGRSALVGPPSYDRSKGWQRCRSPDLPSRGLYWLWSRL